MNARLRTVLSLSDGIGIPIFIGWFIWRGQSVAGDEAGGGRLWLVYDRSAPGRVCSGRAIGSAAELPLPRQAIRVLRLLPDTADCAELVFDE